MNNPTRMLTSVLLLLVSGAAWGQQVTVQSSGLTFPTIGQAVTAAQIGDTLTIDAGTYVEAVVIDRDLTLVGAGTGQTTIQWDLGTAVVSVNPVTALDLSGVTLSSIAVRGLWTDTATSIDVNDVVFSTLSSGSGGAVNLSSTSATFTDCLFDGNTAITGGAISASATDVVVVRSIFMDNDAVNDGGAINVASGSLDVTDSTFDGGSATNGGAIYADAPVTISGCSFSDNSALAAGGAIAHDSGDTLDVWGTLFCNNAATQGGAIDATSAGGSFRNTLFVENISGAGGAFLLSGASTWTVTNNHFLRNNSGANAAALTELGAAVTYTNNLFAFNLGIAIQDSFTSQPVDYNAFYNNSLADIFGAITFGTGNLQGQDPLLVNYIPNGDCSDDDFKPGFGSPLFGAGDPSILNPDGSVSDIGAYGGQGADPALHLDSDGDGFKAMIDCDDNEGDTFPGADEICNGVDDDCNNVIDDDYALDASMWFPDDDGDTFGDDSFPGTVQCDPPVGPPGYWVLTWDDCNDDVLDPNAPAIHPGAVEFCDGIDWDCDGSLTLNATNPGDWYEDVDGDGFGDEASLTVQCSTPGGGWLDGVGGDCDDGDPLINPDAIELCDGVDQNCSGSEDDAADAIPWYPDVDADGFGDDDAAVIDCVPVPDFITDGGDCDDDDADSFPGGVEVCDEADNDCNGVVDDGTPIQEWWADLDGDGYGADWRTDSVVAFCAPYTDYQAWVTDHTDCDDDDTTINPGADEICNDDVDDDCDGLADLDDDDLTDGVMGWPDLDGDGFGDEEATAALTCDTTDVALQGGDCSDADPDTNPDAREVVGNDVDEDCDGVAQSEPVTPKEGTCGCAASPGPSSGFAILLPLALAFRRRSKRQ